MNVMRAPMIVILMLPALIQTIPMSAPVKAAIQATDAFAKVGDTFIEMLLKHLTCSRILVVF